MDSKRKANGNLTSAEDVDDRAVKRRKLPNIDLSGGETPETTTQYGILFVEQIRRTADKSGRLVATSFLTLPSRRDLPDYYSIIKMPIALDTIEAKLKRREFANLTQLESYFKRMIANAKEYNQKGSEIYDDAERLRKALSNYMTKTNPAYKTPGYVAFPTPLPDDGQADETEDAEGSDIDAEGEIDTELLAAALPTKRKPGRPPKGMTTVSGPNAQRSSTTPSMTEAQYSTSVGYVGLTFQQAQEKLVAEMLKHKEDEDDVFPLFEPFINLPPRSLKDYYQVIPHPVSLKGLQKLVRGIHGRNEPTGVSEFKSWRSFEEEVNSIWQNAWHYNEDGSDISILAKDLEIFFNKRLAQAKKHVQEPVQPKLKLKMPSAPENTPKITLRMGGKVSPANSPAPSAGPNGSNDSPRHGIAPRRNPFSGSQTSSIAVPSLGQLDRARSMSGSIASPTPSTSALVKNEDGPKNSPATSSAVPNINHGGPHSSSNPHMNGTSILPPSSTTHNLLNHNLHYNISAHGQPSNPLPTYSSSNPSFESKWREPGKGASDAMITNLTLATHPGLNIARHFRMDLPPSDTMAQQSITINLPHTHYYLQIKPTIAASLLERQHKLFVTSGSNRLHAIPTMPGHPVDPRNPLFEARLLPGVNKIEVELIAALPRGAPKPGSGQDVELEKITVFANLLRN